MRSGFVRLIACLWSLELSSVSVAAFRMYGVLGNVLEGKSDDGGGFVFSNGYRVLRENMFGC